MERQQQFYQQEIGIMLSVQNEVKLSAKLLIWRRFT